MSQRARLEAFLIDAFEIDEIRRLVRGLEYGKTIDSEVRWSQSKAQVVSEVTDLLERREEIGAELFAALRTARPKRADEIAALATPADAESVHAAWRRTLLERFAGRQVLHNVQDTGYELDRVYVDLDLLLQIPGTSVSRSDRADEDPARESQMQEIHGTGVSEQAFDLDGWLLDARPDPTPLILEGEVGSGKTERLIRAVTALARRGEGERTTPLPLWFDAKMLGRPLPQVLADDVGWSESECRALLADTAARFTLFVDSLDEVGLSVNAEIQRLRATFGPRLHRMVLAMRPTRRRSFRDVRVARVVPWAPDRSAAFLQKCRAFDAEAIARIELGRAAQLPDDILATPLTATLSVLVARDQPGALGNRTRLFRAIVDRLVAEWQRQRAQSTGERGQWQDLAPKLAELALERLRDHPDGFDEGFLRDRLDAWSDEGSETLLAVLTAQYGVFVRTGDRYDFALRWLVDYFAGRALGVDPVKIVAAARRPWGFEAVRHAISGAVLRSPDGGLRCLAALLSGEERDPREDRPLHLRRVVLTIATAADLRGTFPAAMVMPLVEAICRRLFGETSNWIGGEVSTAVRALARTRGPVWEALAERISTVLRDPAAPYEDPAIDDWQPMLRHRRHEARVLAAERLADRVDDPAIREDLFALLMDLQWSPAPAFAAAKVLRTAARDATFVARLADLRYLLDEAPQIPSGAAALTLRPHEAPHESLAHGLEAAKQAGEDVGRESDELASAPGGEQLRHSEQRSRGPRVRAWPMTGPRPQVSDHVRWDLVRCIAPALHTLPAEWIAEIVQIGDQSHALSHELLNVSLEVAPAVVHALVRKRFCDRRIDDLASLVAACPEIGEVLCGRWGELVANGCREYECVQFPGQALASLIAQGGEAAAAVVAAWLPHSELGKPQWAWDGPVLPAAAFVHPEVLEAARRCLRAADKLHHSLRLKAYQRLASAWDEGLWEALVPSSVNGPGCWRRVQEMCAYAELPEAFAQRCVVEARSLLGEHRDLDTWHGEALAALRFLDKHRWTGHLTVELRRLVGFDDGDVCAFLLPLASALVMPALAQAEQRSLSARLAATIGEDHKLWSSMSAAALEAVVRPAPDAWLERLMAPRASLLTLPALAKPSKVNWRLWRALPSQVSGPGALALLRSGRCPSVPWTLLEEPGSRQYVRLADLMWQLAYDGGVEGDEDSREICDPSL